MADKKDEKKVEEYSTDLKGTFFDTFAFPEEPKEKTPEELKAEEDAAKAEAEKEKEKEKKEEKPPVKPEDKKEDEKKEETPPEQTPEEIQAEIEKTIEVIKAKEEKDLDDDDKQFLKDYEAGEFKDYKAPEKKEETESTGFDTLAKTLIEEGVLAESDELEDTQESFAKVISQTVDKKVDEYIAEIPDEYKNVIDFMRAGGNVNEYLQSKATIEYDKLNLKDETIQTALVAEILKQENYSPEEIEEKIKDFQDLEKMEKEAARATKIFSKQQADRIKEYDASIAKAIKDQEKAEEKEIEDLEKEIDGMKEIANFKLTPQRKKAFKKYLFEVDNDGETAASRASKDPTNKIKLYFMDFVGYNFDDLERAVTTKKTKDISKILSRYKDTQTKATGVTIEEKDPNDDKFELNIPSMFNRAPEE